MKEMKEIHIPILFDFFKGSRKFSGGCHHRWGHLESYMLWHQTDYDLNVPLMSDMLISCVIVGGVQYLSKSEIPLYILWKLKMIMPVSMLL